MRHIALSRAALIAALCVGTTASPAHAQGLLDALRKKAGDAKRAADEIKRRADSVAAVTARAKTAVDSLGTSTPQQAGATRPGARNTPNSPAATSSTATTVGMTSSPAQGLNRNAARVDEQAVLSGDRLEFILSPHGQHVAARTLKGSRTVVTLDGVAAGPPIDETLRVPGTAGSTGVFSDDGTHFAYVARQGQQWVVVADGKEVARGEPATQTSGNLTMTSIGYTPVANHLYFSTYDESRQIYQFVWDGKPDAAVHGNTTPVFSPQGSRYAYEFVYNQESGHPLPGLIVDGKRAPYPGTRLQFTADGQHLFAMMGVPGVGAMDIMLDGKQFMRVPNGEVHLAPRGPGMLGTVLAIPPNGNRFTFITAGNRRVPNSDCHTSTSVYFSADAKHWAVRCQDTGTSMWVMTDGKRGQDYQSIPSEVQFTADGKPVYLAKANNKSFIVAGEQEFGPYGDVQLQPKTGDPSSAGLLGPAQVAGNHVGFIAKEASGFDVNRIVVVDGKTYKSVQTSDLAFNADGSHFAYVEGQAPRFVVLDGVKRFSVPLTHDPSDDVLTPFVFSPDGQRLAFASANTREQKFAVALDDRLLASDAMWHHDLMFTPDGKHLFYVGRPNGKRERVFLDGTPVLEFDQGASQHRTPEPWMGVGTDGTLTVVAQDGNTLKRYHVAAK